MTFLFSHRPFYDFLPFHILQITPLLPPKIFHFNSQKFLFVLFTFFSRRPFLAFSTLPYFTDNYSYFLLFAHYTPLVYTPTCCFSRFYALLCALVTVYTTYAIYFFLIHHCTNSLSSLHIFLHHCTFCALLHTKTSPVAGDVSLCLAVYLCRLSLSVFAKVTSTL